MSFFYAAFLVVRTLIFGEPVKGYPSMMAAILFIGGVQLIFIGIIGEYIARIHDEVKARPIYVIDSIRGFDEDANTNKTVAAEPNHPASPQPGAPPAA